MHWCADETLMLMAMIPFIGFYFKKLHLWYHMKFKHKCHTVKDCHESHVEHEVEQSAISRSEIIEKVAAGYKREHKLTLRERIQRLKSIRKIT